jgi:hypothetical protein
LVKQSRVRDALHWLRDHNNLYCSVTIRNDPLNELPENDVSESLWQTLHHATDVAADMAERSDYVVDPVVPDPKMVPTTVDMDTDKLDDAKPVTIQAACNIVTAKTSIVPSHTFDPEGVPLGSDPN